MGTMWEAAQLGRTIKKMHPECWHVGICPASHVNHIGCFLLFLRTMGTEIGVLFLLACVRKNGGRVGRGQGKIGTLIIRGDINRVSLEENRFHHNLIRTFLHYIPFGVIHILHHTSGEN